MRIAIVSAYDTRGIQVNGYLLHRYLHERGHDSRMIVYKKFSDDENVHQLGSPTLRRVNAFATRFEYRLGTHCVLPLLSSGIIDLPQIADADIVNLQLIHNAPMFSLLQLPAFSRKRRILLSIHDMFLFTGHCVYSMDCERWQTGCGSCPDLGLPFAVPYDTTELNWKLKKRVFERSDIALVVGSPWQRERVKKSPILSHLPLHYIPYGVNTRVFNVRDKQAARSALGVPPDAHVISFRSPPPGRNFKGAEYVEAALQKYRPGRETWLLIFEGMGGLQSLRTKYKVIEMGWLDDQVTIAQALQAVDLFLMPSTAEAFGLMAIEAMACGVPAIVFEGTALPETINAPECGIAVPYEDSEALAHAIDQVLADEHLRLRLRENGLRYVAANHTFDAYAAGYLELYSRLAAQPRLARA